jgi:serine phosphatase RsbU (regulator of sigma subunit)
MLHYANAGHPAPLLLDEHGTLRRLDAHHSPMIGVVPAAGVPGRGAASVRCAPGSLLLLYTDGLTDVAGDDADARTAALERTVGAVPPGSDAETVVDTVLAGCLPEPLRDDVALLAVRLTR